MDVVGSEIGQKMRSAIKAKLTELGCYVDDELPDYVMVMVANKRTRSQMEDDLQLFLGTNTVLFVGWLHKVLKKLQEVSVSNTIKLPETEETKPPKVKISSKEHKVKEKKEKKATKDKHKKGDGSIKKSKKGTKKKDKESRKKVPKKSKKKSKNDGPIRPNVPPLLMNLEKDSEPSITDVFAGQILKNHGITLEKSITADTKALEDIKPIRKALKRNRFPIIDPATVSNVTDPQPIAEVSTTSAANTTTDAIVVEANENEMLLVEKETTDKEEEKPAVKAVLDIENLPREDQIREMNEIEAKIQGLKKKLADQMDSMSEDEDFLNIRTEAEELMNDFAEDVLQEISAAQNTTSSTPPLSVRYEKTKVPAPVSVPEVLPQIELQLPKRPMRERLGARPEQRPEKRKSSDERVTTEDEERSARCGIEEEREHRRRHVDLPLRHDHDARRPLSKVVAPLCEERRAGPASVVRVRPRPRAAPGAPAPALLMRAVAEAHKSLLNVAPKLDNETQVKRALVLPMRRNVESQNIVIQVQMDRVSSQTTGSRDTSDCEIDLDTESLADLVDPIDNYKSNQDYVPGSIKRSINNQRVQYVPSLTSDSSTVDDDTIKIHNPTVDKERGPQFVVTLDGLDPNVFLAKKLKTEGLSDEVTLQTKRINRESSKDETVKKPSGEELKEEPKKLELTPEQIEQPKLNLPEEIKQEGSPKKQDLKTSKSPDDSGKKRKVDDSGKTQVKADITVKKPRPSPIVFDLHEKEKEREKEKELEKKRETRERKESAGSDITVTTTSSNKKYDSLPSLPTEKRRQPCRTFPACRFGAACAFSHPRCKFLSACSRRDCIYSHPTVTASVTVKAPPVLASHVVPVGNYKSLTMATPAVCKFYPACVNLACPFLHPKPCRYGRTCLNKSECNFYHHDGTKWRAPFHV